MRYKCVSQGLSQILSIGECCNKSDKLKKQGEYRVLLGDLRVTTTATQQSFLVSFENNYNNNKIIFLSWKKFCLSIMLSAKVMDKERNSFPSFSEKETISSQLVLLFLFSYLPLFVQTCQDCVWTHYQSSLCKVFWYRFFFSSVLRLSPNNEICRECLFISSSKNAADDVF